MLSMEGFLYAYIHAWYGMVFWTTLVVQLGLRSVYYSMVTPHSCDRLAVKD